MQFQSVQELASEFVTRIRSAHEREIGVALLDVAASMLESAGYELARSHGPSVAATVILQANEIEKMSARLKSQASSETEAGVSESV